MSLMLDTSILIDLERNKKETIAQLSNLLVEGKWVKIPFVSYVEFVSGLENVSEKRREKAMSIVKTFELIHTSKETADKLVSITNQLKRSGKHIAFPDMFIAAQTMEHDSTLVTKDIDFVNIPNLSVLII